MSCDLCSLPLLCPFLPPPAGAAHLRTPAHTCAHLRTPCVPAVSRSPWPGELVGSARTLREGIHRPSVGGASERRGAVSAWQRQVPVHSRAPPGRVPGSHRTGPHGRCLCSELQVSEPSWAPIPSRRSVSRDPPSFCLFFSPSAARALPLQLPVTTVAVVEAGVPKGAQPCCWLCQSQLLQQHRGCCGDGQGGQEDGRLGGQEARRPAPCRLARPFVQV